MSHELHNGSATPQPSRIEARLGELRERYGDTVPLSEVAAIIAALMPSLRGDVSAHELRVYAELEALARYIERAKREISAIRCDDIKTKHIPLASGELDAIGSHLEEATGVILDACERLEAAGRAADADTEGRISAIVTGVYEACSFQDITGQRIAKVITTLRTIEERIGRLLTVLGDELGAAVREPTERERGGGPPTEARLLNGPQPSRVANSQAEIDALLAAFDR